MLGYKVTVTDEVTLLISADDTNRYAYFNVVGNKVLALGGASVTFATGLQVVKHTAPMEIFVPLGETLYAICDTGDSDDVRVLLPNVD